MTESADGRGAAIRETGLVARSAVHSSALRVAEVLGSQIREEPAWPGAQSTTRRAEPLAGIRAAVTIRDAASAVVHESVRYAREQQTSWLQIGTALGLRSDVDHEVSDLAAEAFDHIAGKPAAGYDPVVHWRCGSCAHYVADHGPYSAHPAENERGHAETCERLSAEVAAWQAERDAWEAGQ